MWKLHGKISQVHNSFPKMCVSEFRIFPIFFFNFSNFKFEFPQCPHHVLHKLLQSFVDNTCNQGPNTLQWNLGIVWGSSIHMNSLYIFPPYMFTGNLGKIIVFRAVWVWGRKKNIVPLLRPGFFSAKTSRLRSFLCLCY